MAKKLTSLDQVIGQKNIVRWFDSCVKRDKLPQVILLHGPAGIGKTSMAFIVACEIAYMNQPEQLAKAKEAVINQGKSTDAVKVFNMSNLKSQDAVNSVKSELTVGFSSTGRKVIVMDEAHGMSDEAQDSLLTTFESLPLNVYVIVCSTEIESFRDAFVSRCITRRLSNLSLNEMKNLIKRRIEENNLKFAMPLNMVYTLISMYTGREPRRAMNLLDSFESGSTITSDDLQTFFDVTESKKILTLVNYLYSGDVLRGLEFINELETINTIGQVLLELLRVAHDGQSDIVDANMTLNLRGLINSDGITPLMGFTIDCTTHSRLTRSQVSGYFLKWCKKAEEIKSPPVSMTKEQVGMDNMRSMSSMIENESVLIHNKNNELSRGLSLDFLMSNGESLD